MDVFYPDTVVEAFSNRIIVLSFFSDTLVSSELINTIDGKETYRILGCHARLLYDSGCLWAFGIDCQYPEFVWCQDFRYLLFAIILFLERFLVLFFNYPPQSLMKVKKRMLGLLFPTIVVGTLFVALMGDGDFIALLFHKSKGGYWFTFVAFEIYLIYAGVTWMLDKMRCNFVIKVCVYVALSVLALPLSYWIGVSGFDKTNVCGLFSIVSIVSYTPFFLLGVVTKIYNENFTKYIENQWIISAILICFIAIHIIAYMYQLQIKLIFTGTVGILMVYAIFYNFRHIFCNRTLIGKSLCYVGKRTLPIYLTHYFLLNGIAPTLILPAISEHLGWITGLIFYFLCALFVVGGCLIIEAIFRKAHPLYRLCFGYPN